MEIKSKGVDQHKQSWSKINGIEADEEGSEVPGDLCDPQCCETLSVLSDWNLRSLERALW